MVVVVVTVVVVGIDDMPLLQPCLASSLMLEAESLSFAAHSGRW